MFKDGVLSLSATLVHPQLLPLHLNLATLFTLLVCLLSPTFISMRLAKIGIFEIVYFYQLPISFGWLVIFGRFLHFGIMRKRVIELKIYKVFGGKFQISRKSLICFISSEHNNPNNLSFPNKMERRVGFPVYK